jgi:hypothetical protein
MNANSLSQGKEAIIETETDPQKYRDRGFVSVSYYKRKFRRELRKRLKRCLREGIA